MRVRRQAPLFVAALALLVACWAGEAKAQYGSVGTAAGYLPVGTTTIPASMLGVYGGITIGTSYISTTAPTNGAIIQGNVGIGTTVPTDLLTVNGDALINGMTVGLGPGSNFANTGVGYQVFAATTTGYSNDAFGYQAFASNTTGYYNSAIGRAALNANTTGIDNVAEGVSSLQTNVSGSRNTAVGFRSLYSNSASYNTAVGSFAGTATTGNYNIDVGYNNTGATTGSNNIVIGNQLTLADGTASGQLNIGNIIFGTGVTGTGSTIAGNVGIGTTSPAQTLEVNGTAKIDTGIIAGLHYPAADSTTAIQFDKANGTSNVVDIDTTNGRVGIGTTVPTGTLHVVGTGVNTIDAYRYGGYYGPGLRFRDANGTQSAPTATTLNEYIGTVEFDVFDGTNFDQAAYIAARAASNTSTSDTSTYLVFETNPPGTATNATERMRIDQNGVVGIGATTMSSSNKLEVNGAATIGYTNTAAPTNGLIVAGNVGIGTTAPNSTLEVAGQVSLETNQLKWGTSGSEDVGIFRYSNGVLFVDNGTASHASGALYSGTLGVGDNGGNGGWYTAGTLFSMRSDAVMRWGNSTAASSGSTYDTGLSRGAAGYVYVGNGAQGNSSGTLIASNVGIGTTTPQSKLHVQAGEVQVGSSGASCATANAGAIRYNAGTLYYCDNASTWESIDSSGTSPTGDYYIATQTATATSGQGLFGGSSTLGGILTGYGSTADVTLQNRSGTAAFEILANSTNVYMPGNLGIGTTSPTQLLHVLGPSGTRSTLAEFQETSQQAFYIEGQTGSGDIGATNGALLYTSGGNLGLRNGNSGNATILINSASNVGIGTVLPANKLDVNGSLAVGTYAGTATGASNELIVGGSVGIGTTSPTSPLVVTAPATFTSGTLTSVVAPAAAMSGVTTMTGLNVNMSAPTFSGGNSGITALSTTAFTGGNNASSNYGIYVGNINGNGSSYNASVYINAATGGTGWGGTGIRITGGGTGVHDYAIYSDDAAQSYFAGNVGIGTPSPNAPLSVYYSSSSNGMTLNNAQGSFGGSIGFQKSGTFFGGVGDARVLIGGATNDMAMIGYSGQGLQFGVNGPSSPSMVINTSGNVGIGTTSPSVPLHIYSSASGASAATNAQMIIEAAGSRYIQFALPTASTGGLVFGDSANNSQGAIYYKNSTASGTDAANAMDFYTATNFRMRIDASGNVGIGTTAPLSTLYVGATGITPSQVAGITSEHAYNPGFNVVCPESTCVKGGLYIGDDTKGGIAGVSYGWATNTLNIYNSYGSGSADKITFATSGAQLAQMNSAGLAIGTTTNRNSLDVYGATAIGLYAGSNSAPSNSLIVSGNVGIGTTAPQSKLHVQAGEVQVGSSGASCASANAGAIRYNAGTLYYCDNASTWESIDSSGTSPTGDYYIATQTATATSGQGLFGGTATLGGILAGYGSTADVTLENRNDTPALEILANSTNIYMPGNVGIGTTAPSNALSVVGTGSFTGALGVGVTTPVTLFEIKQAPAGIAPSLSADNGIATFATSTTPELQIGGYPTSSFAMWMQVKRTSNDGTSWPLSIQPLGGNVGIGTAAPANALDVNGSLAVGTYAGTASGASNELIVSGNVGIGTPSPGSLLDVRGARVLWSSNQGMANIISNSSYSIDLGGSLGLGGSDGVNPRVFSTIMGLKENSTSGNYQGYFAVGTHGGGGPGGPNIAERFRITSAGNVGIDTPTPQNPLDVYGSVAIGTSYAGVSTAPTNGAIIQGNVGIGTTAPGMQVDIVGESGFPATSGSTATGILRLRPTAGSSGATLDMGVDNSSGNGWLEATNFGSGGLANHYALVLNPDGGNVGIGLTNPSGRLSISSSGGTDLVLVTPNTGQTFGVDFSESTQGNYKWQLFKDGSNNFGVYDYARSANDLLIAPNGNMQLMPSGGNVGIGTTAPQSKLHVQAGEVQVGSSGASCASANAGAIRYNSGTLYYCDNSSTWESIDSSGTSPTGDYYIATQTATATSGQGLFGGSSTLGGILTGYGSTADVTLQNRSGTAALEILANSTNVYMPGNVGIGTTGPQTTLDITATATTLANIQANVANNAISINSVAGGGSSYAPGISWNASDNNPTKSLAGIWAHLGASGSYLQFGTSNSYAAGVNNTAMTIDNLGNVGIGTAAPGYVLDVENTSTATSGTVTMETHNLTLNPAATSNAAYTGAVFEVSPTGTSTLNPSQQTGGVMEVNNSNTATIRDATGGVNAVVNNSTGTILFGFANANYSENLGTGTISNAIGAIGETYNASTGTMGNAEGLESDVVNGGLGTITNGYGLYVYYSNAGTVTNWYGIYINGLTGTAPTTNNYGIYEAATSKNYFGGSIGVGVTSPAARLNLGGAVSQSSWTTTGIDFATNAATYTDTSTAAAGTVTTRAVNSNGLPTLASTNAITVTNGSNLYIAGGAVQGTNTTLTNSYGEYIAAGAVGAATNSYGLYVNAQTGATNNYGAVFASGNVGIGTTAPQATLDVNGYARLTLQSSQPVACSSTNQGAIALNHLAQMCACNGTSWIFADSVGASCSW